MFLSQEITSLLTVAGSGDKGGKGLPHTAQTLKTRRCFRSCSSPSRIPLTQGLPTLISCKLPLLMCWLCLCSGDATSSLLCQIAYAQPCSWYDDGHQYFNSMQTTGINHKKLKLYDYIRTNYLFIKWSPTSDSSLQKLKSVQLNYTTEWQESKSKESKFLAKFVTIQRNKQTKINKNTVNTGCFVLHMGMLQQKTQSQKNTWKQAANSLRQQHCFDALSALEDYTQF